MPAAMVTLLHLPFPGAVTGGDALCIQHFQPLKLLPVLMRKSIPEAEQT